MFDFKTYYAIFSVSKNYCVLFPLLAENHEDGLMGATGGIPNDVGPSHQLHDVHEPIMPLSQDLIEGSEKHPKVRKIAAGPALPHYKGS